MDESACLAIVTVSRHPFAVIGFTIDAGKIDAIADLRVRRIAAAVLTGA